VILAPNTNALIHLLTYMPDLIFKVEGSQMF